MGLEFCSETSRIFSPVVEEENVLSQFVRTGSLAANGGGQSALGFSVERSSSAETAQVATQVTNKLAHSEKLLLQKTHW